MSITYEDLSELVTRFDQALRVARTNDSVEALICLAQPIYAKNPAIAWIRDFVANDAQALYAHSLQGLGRLRACHQWLEQSRDSVKALGVGSDAWAEAATATSGARVVVEAVAHSDAEWEGGGSEAQRAKARQQAAAQEELLLIAHGMRSGCLISQNVMSAVFADAAASIGSVLLGALGQTSRAPSVTLNVFALNSRMRALASALSHAAGEYEAIRAGRGWMSHSNALADRFQALGRQIKAIPRWPVGATPY